MGERVGITEVAALFNVAQNTAWRWSRRDDFPEPAERLASGPIWRRADIEAWAERTGRSPKRDNA